MCVEKWTALNEAASILTECWLSPWNNTSHLIDLQAVSTQGANQALIRHHWLTDDGSDSGSRVHGLTERRRLIARGRLAPDYSPQMTQESWSFHLSQFTRFGVIAWEVKGKACVCYFNYCLLPNLWIRPPVPPIGPQIICWSSLTHTHTQWSSTFMRGKKQEFTLRNCEWTVKKCALYHIHDSIWYFYIRQTEKI